MNISKNKYRVTADSSMKQESTFQKLEVLDTGAGPNFVSLSHVTRTEFPVANGTRPIINDTNRQQLKLVVVSSFFDRFVTYVVKL